MNQILSTDSNQKKQNNGGLLDMRKIVIIFSVIIIVFALILIVVKIISTVKENNKKGNPIEILNKPNIEVNKLAGNMCQIDVKYDEGINKVSYWWNEEDSIEKNLNGRKTVDFALTIPDENTNILHIKAEGTDGSVQEMVQNFFDENIEEPNKPKIEIYDDNSVKITSEKGLKHISYNWEGEETTDIELNGEEEYKFTIEPKRGENKLFISATDIDDNVKNKERLIVGVYEPEIEMYIENNETLKIRISHDMGFKQIIININGEELIYDENNPQYSKENTKIETSYKVKTGRLDVEITTYTLEEPEKAYVKSGHANIQQ